MNREQGKESIDGSMDGAMDRWIDRGNILIKEEERRGLKNALQFAGGKV
jgi:hypothetical protein